MAQGKIKMRSPLFKKSKMAAVLSQGEPFSAQDSVHLHGPHAMKPALLGITFSDEKIRHQALQIHSVVYLFLGIFISNPTLSRKRFNITLFLWKKSENENTLQKTNFLFQGRFLLCH